MDTIVKEAEEVEENKGVVSARGETMLPASKNIHSLSYLRIFFCSLVREYYYILKREGEKCSCKLKKKEKEKKVIRDGIWHPLIRT